MFCCEGTDCVGLRLGKLIADSPQLAEMVAGKLRQRKDTYTVGEAAQKLGVCAKTIRNRIEAKTIPVVPGLGAKRIPAKFIDQLVNPNPDA